jgi:hypothetical protein
VQRSEPEAGDHPAEAIETIRVVSETIVEAYERNLDRADLNHTVVIRVLPAFTSSVSAELYTIQSGNSYPSEMSPKPLHIEPVAFIEARGENLVSSPAAEDEEAREVWRSDVKSSLKEEVDVEVGTVSVSLKTDYQSLG